VSFLKHIFYFEIYLVTYILLFAPLALVAREFEPIPYDTKMLINIAGGVYLILAFVVSKFSADQVAYYNLTFADAFLAPYRYLSLLLKKDKHRPD